VKELLSFYLKLPRSEIRKKILLSLLEQGKTLADLKAELHSRDTTILHSLKDLEAIELTIKSEKNYSLTSIGIIEAMILKNFSQATDVLENYKSFWLQHDITSIPPHLIQRISELQNSILIKADNLELASVHENFLKILQNSKRIKGISPIFHPEFIDTFNHLLRKGAVVELILTNQVFEKITENVDLELVKKYISKEKLKILLIHSSRLALTVTDNAFSLGLSKLSGEYDYLSDLISYALEARRWGEELFQYYYDTAEIIKLDELIP
jgi:predicted transcriptional regulator